MGLIMALVVLITPLRALGFGVSPGTGANSWNKSSIKLGGYLVNYSGVKSKSLGGKRGFGGEIISERGTRGLGFIGKVRGEYSSASAYFDDGGTERSLSYELIMGEAGFGVKVGLFPTPRFIPYVTASGLVGFAGMTFSNRSLTELKSSESALTLGYELGAGVELEFKRDKGEKFLIWGEVQSRKSSTNLADQSQFALDALRLILGVGW